MKQTDNSGTKLYPFGAGVDPDDNLYVLDVWRSQAESNVWVETFIDMIAKPTQWLRAGVTLDLRR